MLDKQIYDLEKEDLIEHAVWFFPMDDTVEDELTARPMQSDNLVMGFRLVVKTTFTDCEGNLYTGYVYWSEPDLIGDIQPVLFTGNEDYISFWNGIVKPSWQDYTEIQQKIKDRLPITYQSEPVPGLPTLSGTLEGLYFLDENNHLRFVDN